MNDFEIKKIKEEDRSWVKQFINDHWGSNMVVIHEKKYIVDNLRGFIALDSTIENMGIGTRLLENVKDIAVKNKCCRLCLITANDNTDALRFYQMRGFIIKNIYIKEIEISRKIKPEIPIYGINSIPIRDEIELEMKLS